ncbi:putative O-methyltransferase YrrM [Bradyrhizobium sp. LA8.1]|uniref:class I SAM-dependent methyltransferase n=1 Tax=unclassified Bradyrhizobium TaxID=2631580 RepID=UPI0033991BF9
MKKYESNVLQDPGEIAAYCDVLRSEKLGSYLEIGSKFGGSLWPAANALPKGSRIVSVDMPNGTKAWKDSQPALLECIKELKAAGYDASVIWGDSGSEDVIAQVAALGPFDAVLIDADHRMPGVTRDWSVYGAMSRKLVAFHDIAWRRAPDWHGTRIDVPEFWNSVKGEYRHQEIKLCPTGKNNGIGVLWKN